MSSTKEGDDHKRKSVDDDVATEELNPSDNTDDNPMPSSEQEEETIKKKYGGLVPKKPPLISKDHERAFFDSADWALGKGKPKGPLEALRPKLQPTPHQQVRRSAYGPTDDGEEGSQINTESKDQSTLDSTDDNTHKSVV